MVMYFKAQVSSLAKRETVTSALSTEEAGEGGTEESAKAEYGMTFKDCS